MKLFAFTFTLFLISSTAVFSQSYIATDSTSLTGARIITGTPQENSYSIKVMITNKEMKVYTPKDLKEYGLADGTVYISREISVSGFSKRVFLRQLVKGKLTLYHYDGKEASLFFIERDSSGLVTLTKENESYRKILAENMQDCPAMESSVKIVKYNKSQLASLVKQYHTCNPKPVVYAKFGVLAGVVMTKMDPSEILPKASFDSYLSPAVGVYADIPLFHSNLSLNIAPYFSKNNFADNVKYVSTDRSPLFGDGSLDITSGEIYIRNEFMSVDIPVLLKYTFLKSRLRPFACAGAVYSFNFNNGGEAYMSIFEDFGADMLVKTEKMDAQTLTEDQQLGYSFGGGVQYSLQNRKTISVEIRSSRMSAESTSLNRNQLILFTAFTF